MEAMISVSLAAEDWERVLYCLAWSEEGSNGAYERIEQQLPHEAEVEWPSTLSTTHEVKA